jgi:hypothetical protein
LALFLLLSICCVGAVIAALGMVLALKIANDISDSFDWVRWTAAPNFVEIGHDIANTVFWPVLLAAGVGKWAQVGYRRE